LEAAQNKILPLFIPLTVFFANTIFVFTLALFPSLYANAQKNETLSRILKKIKTDVSAHIYQTQFGSYQI
jgi:hypothetical protein